ncbi:MAG: two-component system response regulator, partial [Acidobacteriota bacterium]
MTSDPREDGAAQVGSYDHVVDDEEDVAAFFKKTFSNFKNVDFLTANRADLGVEVALREKPKLVMLDLRMPGMGGEEALKILKKELPNTKYI